MELQAITCPNCGANTTNHENCDYCGSLLVRFVGTDVDLSKTSYTSDENTFSGLVNSLLENLKSQESTKNVVATDIFMDDESHAGGKAAICSVITTKLMVFDDDSPMFPDKADDVGLGVSFRFSPYVDENGFKEFNKTVNERHKIFKSLDSFILFNKRNVGFTQDFNGYKQKSFEYAIDFGKDYVGAARLISEIAIKVFGCASGETLDIYTNAGSQNIQKCRNVIKGVQTNSTSGGCYVATSVYGSYDCPEVWTLRRFRDNTLDATWYGRLFIKTYYAISPTLVRWFGNTEWFRQMWKKPLDKMVNTLQEKGYESTPYNDKY